MTISSTGAGVNCGHMYAAIAIPEVSTVMTRMEAISRQKDEKVWRMSERDVVSVV